MVWVIVRFHNLDIHGAYDKTCFSKSSMCRFAYYLIKSVLTVSVFSASSGFYREVIADSTLVTFSVTGKLVGATVKFNAF